MRWPPSGSRWPNTWPSARTTRARSSGTPRRWPRRCTTAGSTYSGASLGFTKSHTVAVRVANEGGGEDVARRLSAVGIITNKNLLPGDKSPKHPQGIRLGSPEVTRVGMKEREMDRIAEIMHQLLHQGKDATVVAADVAELKGGFTTLQDRFGAGEAAYRYDDLVGRDPS